MFAPFVENTGGTQNVMGPMIYLKKPRRANERIGDKLLGAWV
jgi:hypothetical protein